MRHADMAQTKMKLESDGGETQEAEVEVDLKQLVIAAPKKTTKKFTVADFMTDEELNSQAAICFELSDKPNEFEVEAKETGTQDTFAPSEAEPPLEVEAIQRLKEDGVYKPESVQTSQKTHEVNEHESQQAEKEVDLKFADQLKTDPVILNQQNLSGLDSVQELQDP